MCATWAIFRSDHLLIAHVISTLKSNGDVNFRLHTIKLSCELPCGHKQLAKLTESSSSECVGVQMLATWTRFACDFSQEFQRQLRWLCGFQLESVWQVQLVVVWLSWCSICVGAPFNCIQEIECCIKCRKMWKVRRLKELKRLLICRCLPMILADGVF